MRIAIPLFEQIDRARRASARTRCSSACPAPPSPSSANDAGAHGPHRERFPRPRRSTPRYDDLPDPDVIVVPGGIGTRADARRPSDHRRGCVRPHADDALHDVGVHRLAGARPPPACSTGSPRPRTGRATTTCAQLGAIPTEQRVVEHLDRRIITAAGVSSGIDMALRLSELLVDDVAAKAMQLMVEYDPQPPFDAGSVAKAGEDVIARVIEYAQTKQ